MVTVETFNVDLRSRPLRICYYAITFMLWEVMTGLTLRILKPFVENKPIWFGVVILLISYLAMNNVNHLTLVYHSFRGVSKSIVMLIIMKDIHWLNGNQNGMNMNWNCFDFRHSHMTFQTSWRRELLYALYVSLNTALQYHTCFHCVAALLSLPSPICLYGIWVCHCRNDITHILALNI